MSNAKKTAQKKPITTAEILPEDWGKPTGQAFVRAFSMVGVAQRDLSPPIRVVLGDVCVFMMWSALPSLTIGNAFDVQADGDVVVTLTTPSGNKAHQEGPVALFIGHPDVSEDPKEASIRVDEIVAQLTTFGGLFLAFEHLEDYWIKFPGDGLSGSSTVILDTTWWEPPDTSQEAQHRWQLAQSAIANADEPDRIRLSLRWLDEAKRSKDVDAFLKLWFALEILTASTGQKVVSRINGALSTSYGVGQNEIGRQFGIGRIFSLRSKIVHHGLKLPLSGSFLNYVAGVYVDLLVPLLGFQHPESARTTRDEAGGINNLLPAIVGGRAEEADAEKAGKTAEEASGK
jgi:Apea-like HEPN